MTAAILGALGALIVALAPTVGKLFAAWFARRQENQRTGQDTIDEAHKAIANADAATVSRLLNDAVRLREDAGGGDPK